MVAPPIAAILFSPGTISPGWNSHPVERPLLCTRRSEEDSEMHYCSRVLPGFTCRTWLTSPRRVFSILPFTSLAKSASSSTSRWAVIIGVLEEEQRTFFSHGSFNTFLLLAIINHPTSSDLLGPRTHLHLPSPPLKRREKKGLFHRKVVPPMWLLYLMFLEALIISLMRGTPRVMFMEATPAKWKVLRVIWVPGSPMLWAQRAPTAEPGSIWALGGRCRQEHRKVFKSNIYNSILSSFILLSAHAQN